MAVRGKRIELTGTTIGAIAIGEFPPVDRPFHFAHRFLLQQDGDKISLSEHSADNDSTQPDDRPIPQIKTDNTSLRKRIESAEFVFAEANPPAPVHFAETIGLT